MTIVEIIVFVVLLGAWARCWGLYRVEDVKEIIDMEALSKAINRQTASLIFLALWCLQMQAYFGITLSPDGMNWSTVALLIVCALTLLNIQKPIRACLGYYKPFRFLDPDGSLLLRYYNEVRTDNDECRDNGMLADVVKQAGDVHETTSETIRDAESLAFNAYGSTSQDR